MKKLLTLICFFGGFLGSFSSAMAAQDALPPLNTAKLNFGTGEAANNKPIVEAHPPALPGATSAWTVLQWQQSSLLSTATLAENSPATQDSRLGLAAYGFTAPDKHAHLWVYKNKQGNWPVFELFEKNGWVTSGGGSNIFLSANTLHPSPKFNENLSFSMLVKVSQASVSYDTPNAKVNGSVLGSAFVGFVISMINSNNKKISTLFLQLPITSSRNPTPASENFASCQIHNKQMTIITGGNAANAHRLPFQPDNGPLHEISYNLNDALKAALNRKILCKEKNGPPQTIVLKDIFSPRDISVSGVYIGLETENTDKRPEDQASSSQGNIQLGIQISNPKLTIEP